MKPLSTACLLVALMTAAMAGAVVGKPTRRLAEEGTAVRLAQMVPSRFGVWQEDRGAADAVVDPQAQDLVNRIYDQVLSRTYVDGDGYRIMLSLAYGADQRPSYSHRPEVCYPSQGFKVLDSRPGALGTRFGTIPVQRLDTALGARREPLTYWFTVGEKAVTGELNKRIVEIGYGFSGRIPDGMLVRVSSIDANPAHAYEAQQRFVQQLIDAIGSEQRTRLAGLATR